MNIVRQLQHNEVHIWCVDARNIANSDVFLELLTDEEKRRADRLMFAKHRNYFIITRGMLRQLLGKYLDVAATQIEFNYGKHGKPTIDQAKIVTPLQFNLSHSHDLILFAFTNNMPLGVDIEYIRKDIVAEEIAARFFSTAEIAALSQLPDARRIRAFFNCWTRKEAFIKAVGEGLSFPLNQFDVNIGASKKSLLLQVHHKRYHANDWKLLNLNIAKDYTAALAVHSPERKTPKFSIDICKMSVHNSGLDFFWSAWRGSRVVKGGRL